MKSASTVEGGAFAREAQSRCRSAADRTADRSTTCAIAVMAKASVPGLTKTRLVPPLSADEAADLNSAFLSDIAENLALAGREADIAAYMAFGPPGSAPFFEAKFSAEVGLLEIWFADFGDCLFQTIARLLASGYGSVCVLNSDSPTLPTARLVDAARALAAPGDRVVLGPSTDGGYYLLGVKAPHRRLFDGISWSTEVVAAQTTERVAELGLHLVTLAPWYDVDDHATLQRLAGEVGALPHALPASASTGTSNAPGSAHVDTRHAARHTAATLHGLAAMHPGLFGTPAGDAAGSTLASRAADFA